MEKASQMCEYAFSLLCRLMSTDDRTNKAGRKVQGLLSIISRDVGLAFSAVKGTTCTATLRYARLMDSNVMVGMVSYSSG